MLNFLYKEQSLKLFISNVLSTYNALGFRVLTGTSGLVNTLSSSFFSLGGTGTHSLSAMEMSPIIYCLEM